MKELENKTKVIAILAIIIVAGISVGVYFAEKNNKVDVRLGYLEGDLHQLAYYVAMEQGLYEKEGLRVQTVAFDNGGNVMANFESASRDIDMAYLGTAPALYHRFNNAAANVKIVAGVNVNGSSLIVKNDGTINDIADLKGKTIAVPARYNMQDFILSMILDLANLTYDDITIAVQSPPEMVLALQQGSIDGYVAWEPYCVKGLENDAGKYLVNSSQVWPNHPCCVIAAHEDFINEHPDIVEKVVKVHKEATEWIWAHPDEARAIAMEKMNLSVEQALEAMNNIGYVYGIDKSKFVEFVDKLVELNPDVSLDSPYIPQGLNSTGFVDWFIDESFLQALESA